MKKHNPKTLKRIVQFFVTLWKDSRPPDLNNSTETANSIDDILHILMQELGPDFFVNEKDPSFPQWRRERMKASHKRVKKRLAKRRRDRKKMSDRAFRRKYPDYPNCFAEK